jgi:hypothetical protein
VMTAASAAILLLMVMFILLFQKRDAVVSEGLDPGGRGAFASALHRWQLHSALLPCTQWNCIRYNRIAAMQN